MSRCVVLCGAVRRTTGCEKVVCKCERGVLSSEPKVLICSFFVSGGFKLRVSVYLLHNVSDRAETVCCDLDRQHTGVTRS